MHLCMYENGSFFNVEICPTLGVPNFAYLGCHVKTIGMSNIEILSNSMESQSLILHIDTLSSITLAKACLGFMLH